MKIENWKELVGYQECIGPTGLVFYLDIKGDDNTLAFNTLKDNIVMNMSEETMLEKLDEILLSFTDNCKNDAISIEKAKIESVKKTHRAMPNKTYKNAMFYKGESEFDCSVVVCHFENKYGIYVHPYFNNYGFMIND